MSIKLTFRALARRRANADEGLTLETSALYSLRWPIYICYPHRRSTTVFLETFTPYFLIWAIYTACWSENDYTFWCEIEHVFHSGLDKGIVYNKLLQKLPGVNIAQFRLKKLDWQGVY